MKNLEVELGIENRGQEPGGGNSGRCFELGEGWDSSGGRTKLKLGLKLRGTETTRD